MKKSWNQGLFNKYIVPMGGQFSYKGDVEGVQGAQHPLLKLGAILETEPPFFEHLLDWTSS